MTTSRRVFRARDSTCQYSMNFSARSELHNTRLLSAPLSILSVYLFFLLECSRETPLHKIAASRAFMRMTPRAMPMKIEFFRFFFPYFSPLSYRTRHGRVGQGCGGARGDNRRHVPALSISCSLTKCKLLTASFVFLFIFAFQCQQIQNEIYNFSSRILCGRCRFNLFRRSSTH